ncbi:EpsG family protein [Flavobacterium sp. CYK-55]|uniref:EpsG family protein n=1 Tax=Flavobacterium sp. CYK-55 TaxID=2835529 RepID=UPI001BCE7ED6|nr:EpsG family protein [Flavobacterium sp. CYK-55]MBS7786436.1 EpsG family protein [Flavobacterium sp. CYK-55]
MDSTRYVAKLQELYQQPISWESFISSFYSEDGDTVDIYQPLVTYLMSMVTDSGNLLFAVFGFVFGYFYSRNIWLMIDLARVRWPGKEFWIMIAAFACVIGFWNLNGVRMWTAGHIFFYGAFLHLFNNQKKGILIAASSILVHFSFVVPLIALALFYLIKSSWRFLYFVFLGSFFISTLNIQAVRNQIESTAPEFLLPRVNRYTSDEYVETVTEFNAQAVWYIDYYTKALTWFIAILFTVIYFTPKKKSESSPTFINLYGFSMLIMAVGNIMSLLPSGSRFEMIGQMFGLAMIIYFWTQYDFANYRKWFKIASPLMIFFVFISMRVSLETLTFTTVLTNPVLVFFVDLPFPLINLIK